MSTRDLIKKARRPGSKLISVRIPESLLSHLDEICLKENVKRNAVVSQVLAGFVAKYGRKL